MEAYEEALTHSETLTPDQRTSYARKVGLAMYAGPAVHFNALHALGMCARCLTFPTRRMVNCIDRVIAYMAQTASLGITFDGTRADAMVYEAYSDSYWCVSHSTTGGVHVLGDREFAASSERQHSISLSSTEAEYHGCLIGRS